MNQEIHAPRRAGATDLEAIPTMDLIAELARRERIALRLAIEEALAPVSYAKARLSARYEGDEGNAESNRE
jgi:hypothetical protein